MLVALLSAGHGLLQPASLFRRESLQSGKPVMAMALNAERQWRAFSLKGGIQFPGKQKRNEKKGALVVRRAAEKNEVEKKPLTAFEKYVKVSDLLTNLFPLWTVIFSAWGLTRPQDFLWLTTEYFTAGLALLMLSMGITLTPKDFAKVASRPGAVGLNFVLCYGFMPLLGFSLGKLFGLDSALLAGLVLVSAVNGGQASNLCTLIAKGNVALSVLATTATTIGAIFATPFICKQVLGTVVPVDALGIAISTIQVVLGPIAAGMIANTAFPKVVDKIKPATPLVGVAATCFLVASSVGQVAEQIKAAGITLQLPVLLLHLIGGIMGYWISRLIGYNETTSRTMAIETAMKSSAFGFLLAKLHFGLEAVRVPSAVSVVWMALTGSTLAVIWRFIPVPPGEEEEAAKTA